MTSDQSTHIETVNIAHNQKLAEVAFEQRTDLLEHCANIFRICLIADQVAYKNAIANIDQPNKVPVFLLSEFQGFPAKSNETIQDSISLMMTRSEKDKELNNDDGVKMVIHMPVAEDFDTYTAKISDIPKRPEKLAFEVTHASTDVESLVVSLAGLSKFIKNSNETTRFDEFETELEILFSKQPVNMSTNHLPLVTRLNELSSELVPIVQRHIKIDK